MSGINLGCLTVNETIIPGAIGCYQVNEIYHTSTSKFQKVHVVDLQSFGRTLMLDEKMQSATSDEFIYHENLVYPSMLMHNNPKKILILGGGEGATAREVLRFKSVERCVMVDIDEVVIETSKKYLTTYHQGAWDDPRMELIVGDAKAYLENTEEKWDVIVGDLADPLPGGPCYLLYTVEFYTMLMSKLAPNGIFVTQSGPCGLFSIDDVCLPVFNTLSRVFKHSVMYHTHTPSFFDHYAFTMASNDIEVSTLPQKDIEKLIEEKVDATHEPGSDKTATGNNVARAIDNEAIQGSFLKPKWMKSKIENNKTIIRNDSPAYLK